MTCARCSREVENDSMYCRFCGASLAGPATPRRFSRVPGEGRVAGVCAGIAAYLDADVTLVRLAWVVLSIVPGAFIGGVLAYAVAWLIMPVAGAGEAAAAVRSRLVRPSANRQIAGVCAGLADYFGVDPTVVRVASVVLAIYPGAIVFGILAYLIAWFIIPSAPAVPREPVPSLS
jgi:phage shock protein C